ncbi:L-fuculose-phosphate aldolase [Capronia epimyces CBS 606.96]|uniref:L-fuculose-phosphate aldolase n=1 Tax=Capronia epimyces CBS 606.96 TaxID=1182542 RepID=W9YP48_9EURO|nr:L-fuculose-phosphate aldolase [Capronia epimyces CBS 606.96]EXJ84039.1 L-fuculose-phosphate aldolase [Capronia epimyces CBS 606.96]
MSSTVTITESTSASASQTQTQEQGQTQKQEQTQFQVQLRSADDGVLNWNVRKVEGLHQIPVFSDKEAERTWAKQHMAAAFRTFARLGWADGASGHISLRDPVNPDWFWINPYAKHFALIKASDLVLVDHHGRPVQPTPYKVNAAGFIIHSSIHRARPDIHAACHMHSPAGRAWSAFGRGIEMLNQDSCMFYKNLAVYEGFGGIVLAEEEGVRLAEALGKNCLNLILQNHGLLTCGSTVDEAAAYFIALERACANQILAESAAANGIAKKYVGAEEAEYTCKCTSTPGCAYMQFQPEFDLTVELSNGKVLE